MNRSVQGLCIVLGSIASIAAVLAAALAWGPHHCEPEFPKIVGCAIATYEDLAGAMVAAAAAVFAGWLAWSGVQVQIAVEEKRAAADRVEVEQVLQDDLDTVAEVLGAIWKILDRWDEKDDPKTNERKLSGVIFGIESITKDAWLSSSRKMVPALGWKRRRDYEQLFAGLERLGKIREANFDIYDAISAVRSVSIDFEQLRPDTGRYFEGRFRRAGKAYTIGYAVEVQAGVAEEGRASFNPED
jgi:hypothetical protein